LVKDNVTVVNHGVSALTKMGCRSDDGEEHFFDVIICATGFNTSFIPRFPIRGFDGQNLQDVWASKPNSYLGMAVPGFPNFLTLLGPHSPVNNGPTLYAMGKG
jgi:cation diffusion facilitator CzcD-associated flavoprotein CzcO